jgi:hypothetical protein
MVAQLISLYRSENPSSLKKKEGKVRKETQSKVIAFEQTSWCAMSETLYPLSKSFQCPSDYLFSDLVFDPGRIACWKVNSVDSHTRSLNGDERLV